MTSPHTGHWNGLPPSSGDPERDIHMRRLVEMFKSLVFIQMVGAHKWIPAGTKWEIIDYKVREMGLAQCKYICYMCMPTCFFCSMIISMFGDRKLNNLHRCKLANIFDMVMVRMQHILQQKHFSGSLIRSTYQGRQKLLNPGVTRCPNT